MDRDEALRGVLCAVNRKVDLRARASFVVPPSAAGIAQVFMRPHNLDAPEVCVTDTTVSFYLEFLGAHWEADSSEDVSFAERVNWAVEMIANAAEFGLIRVRRRGSLWGRQTHLLMSAGDKDAWRRDSRFRIVRSWPSWS
ncbi:hypothetical protein P2P98_18560 [Microbacterium sp. Kw_RZR3]|uniref:hypothetical protein n=1 Tax=Microbacterium sp. Kw_RZR3 TaxID=3032903 RepID=UPI0023DAF60F|nr:hypothetical protein [Microbacterium sp. Kw_RZR3]MDF2048171.1 hypothetical protein [Microbacterium sp. Kw_RZR3]